MRIRVRFTKHGKVRFTSHRDLARIWERAVRRSELPVAYSQGFSPRPKLHFGLALPTGAESVAEYLDIDLRAGEDLDDLTELPTRLTGALPVGIDVTNLASIPPDSTSLQEAVTSSTWLLELTDADDTDLLTAIDRLLAAGELMTTRQRKGRDVTDDIRPYLLGLTLGGPDRPAERHLGDVGGPVLVAELGTQPRALRPSELVAALGEPFREGRICRTHQWMQQDGARQEPLPDPATSAPHAMARAS